MARDAQRWRFLAFLAVLAFAAIVVVGGYRVVREQSLLLEAHRSGNWMLVQAQVELLKLRQAIAAHRLAPAAAAAGELSLRFDIFWSRIPLVLESDEAAGVRRVPEVVGVMRRLAADLRRLEAAIGDGTQGDGAALAGADAVLASYEAPLHELVTQVLLQDELVYSRQALVGRVQELAIAFFALCVSGVVIVAMLLRQLRRSEALHAAAAQANAEAERTRTRLADVIDSVDAAITYVDAGGRLVLANEAYRRLYPALRDMIRPGVPFSDLLRAGVARGLFRTGPDPARWIEQRLRRQTAIGEPFELRLANERVLLIRDRRSADGGVVSVRVDITAVIETRRLLEQRLQAIEASSDGIAIADAEGRFTYMSLAHARLFGFADGTDPIGRNCSELYALDGAALADGRAWAGETNGRRCDGSVFPVEVHLKPLVDGGYVLAVRDIADRRRAEAEKEQLTEQFFRAQKLEAVGRLAGGIAHDFNNILGAILGYGAMLLEDLPAASDQHAFVQQIVKAGENGRDLVQQILAFSRPQMGAKVTVDLGRLLADTRDMLKATLPSSIGLEIETPEEPLGAYGNATQLSQVLLNLCVNAADALDGRSGRLTMRLAREPELGIADWPEEPAGEGDPAGGPEAAMRVREFPGEGRTCIWLGRPRRALAYARLDVRDDGIGMSRDVAERMFDPFYTTKDAGKGTGLGLAAVQGIVLAHEGAIAVDTAAGRGTTFRIYLPIAGADGTAGQASAAVPPAPAGSGIVLLVDDEVAVGTQLALRLERLGYRVERHDRPELAVAAFEASPDRYRAVVTDLTMPNLTGVELARRLLALRPSLPVFLLSGNLDALSAESAGGPAFAGVFAKPVDFAVLAQAVAETLAAGPSGPSGIATAAQ